MKLSDDFDNDNIKSGISLGAMMAAVISFMILLVAVVLIVNKPANSNSGVLSLDNGQNGQNTSASVSMDAAKDSEYPVGESTLTSDELDFWNMYKEDKELDKTLDHTSERYAENLEKLTGEDEEEDLSENGTKMEVILPDGTSQWVMINAYIEKNNYDYTGLVYEEPYMRYYADGKKVSKLGIKIDDSYGTIDFYEVEESRIDYCIIRLGKRGVCHRRSYHG